MYCRHTSPCRLKRGKDLVASFCIALPTLLAVAATTVMQMAVHAVMLPLLWRHYATSHTISVCNRCAQGSHAAGSP